MNNAAPALALVVAALAVASTTSAATIEMDVLLHDNLHIAPDVINANVGDTLRLRVQNQGAAPHDMVVCGDASCGTKLAFTPRLTANQTAPLTFTPSAPGSFDYYCSIPGHKEGGMKGTLNVQGEAAPEKDAGGHALVAALVAAGAVALALRRRRA